MVLSKTCVNAIRATLAIGASTVASGKRYVPVRDIADQIGISHHFLGKIAQTLIEAGILTSFRGPNGGVGLARSAGQICLLDIIEAIDGISVFEKCILGLPECNDHDPCALHRTWEKSRDGLLRELRTQSVAKILKRRKEAG